VLSFVDEDDEEEDENRGDESILGSGYSRRVSVICENRSGYISALRMGFSTGLYLVIRMLSMVEGGGSSGRGCCGVGVVGVAGVDGVSFKPTLKFKLALFI
jgi:hypothetical protein